MNLTTRTSSASVAGAGALAACLILAGMARPSAPVDDDHEGDSNQLSPQPRDLVRILEGETYVVPRGRVLAIRTLTSTGRDFGTAVLKINGQAVLQADTQFPLEFVLGVAARAGDTVTVEEDFPVETRQQVALGFLADD